MYLEYLEYHKKDSEPSELVTAQVRLEAETGRGIRTRGIVRPDVSYLPFMKQATVFKRNVFGTLRNKDTVWYLGA
jgi:hypothetical protein